MRSTVAVVQARYVDLLAPIASRLNLSFEAFGKQFVHGNRDDEDFVGRVTLTDAYGTALDPAPISPTAGNGPWELLSGTILSTLETALRSKYAEKDAVVVPGLSLGA